MISMIKRGEKVLLLGKRSYIAETGKDFHCEYGTLNLKKVVGKNFGIRIKSNLKEQFTVVKPSIVDMLFRMKRAPQAILPKDSAAISAVTGYSKGWNIAEAGTGSAYLSIFTANIINPGKLYTFEKRKDFFKVASRNIKESGLKNIIIKNQDINKTVLKKDLDMIILDMENPEKVIKKAFSSIKPGGWLVVYSMHMEELQEVCKEALKYSLSSPRIIENIWIEWQNREAKYTRPKSHLSHTGFISFFRKI